MSNLEARRRQAESDHAADPQAPMKNEQEIRNAEQRDAYNAEIARQRRGN